MLAASAALLNIEVVVLDNGEDAPAKQIIASSSHINGSFSDPLKIRELAEKVHVLTIEIEHVDASVLEDIERTSKVQIHPSPSTIRAIQDKFIQKEHLNKHGVAVAAFKQVESNSDSVVDASKAFGFPLMLKSRTLAYDGRGNYLVRESKDVSAALEVLKDKPLYVERFVPFAKEIAVMVVRTLDGDVESYPVVETVHKDNICQIVFAPLRHANPSVHNRARQLAEDAVRSFSGAGIFGVEMFLLNDGKASHGLDFSYS